MYPTMACRTFGGKLSFLLRVRTLPANTMDADTSGRRPCCSPAWSRSNCQCELMTMIATTGREREDFELERRRLGVATRLSAATVSQTEKLNRRLPAGPAAGPARCVRSEKRDGSQTERPWTRRVTPRL